MIGYGVDHLGVYNDRVKGNQVRDKHTDVVTFVANVEWRLLSKRDALQAELNHEGIFIRFLDNSVADGEDPIQSLAAWVGVES